MTTLARGMDAAAARERDPAFGAAPRDAAIGAAATGAPEPGDIGRLRPGDRLTGIFLLRRSELRRTKNGKEYLDVELGDRKGSAIGAKLWDAPAPADLHAALRAADLAFAEGEVETYNDRPQARLRALEPAPEGAGGLTLLDFLPRTEKDVRALFSRLVQIVRGIGDPHVRELCLAFLRDPGFCERFTRAPAAVSNHHACVGGLLEHVVSLAEACLKLADAYPALDRDLLVAGAFLHDVGKVEELTVGRGFEYSDRGRLVGHIVIGVLALEERARRIDGFPPDLLDRLRHLILSHHGELEWGSPVEPLMAEAIALHALDNLDAKLWAFERAARDAAASGEAWTPYQRLFGRRLFAGGRGTSSASGNEEI